MSLLAKAKINKISLDLSNYLYYIQGVQKCGKTTFVRDFTMSKYGDPSKTLLLAIGREKGYTALNNINALDIEDFSTFLAVIKELVQTKGENGIEFIAIDIFDELIPLCEAYVCKLSTRDTGKVCKSINSAYNGYGSGRAKVREILTEAISTLNKHYGVIVLGHTKLKTVKEQGETEELSYQVMSSNLNADYHNIIAHKADVIGTVIVERSVNSESKRVSGVETSLYLRGTHFIDAGSRFENIEPKIPFKADIFIETIENAIKSSTQEDVSKFQELAAKEKAEREERISKETEKDIEALNENTKNEAIDKKELINSIKTSFMSATVSEKATTKEIMTKYNATKLDENLSVEALEEMIKVFK